MNNAGHWTVVEWFSGIGGMRFAFELLFDRVSDEARPQYSFVSFDINQIANSVYSASFPGDQPRMQSIEALSLASVEALNGDVWLLSPPCQPYTLGGTQLDEKDTRSRALLHLISILERMEQPPTYLLLENVPRFECSNSRFLLVSALSRRNYRIEEFLISPTDPVIEIPNARLRYYLLAKRGFDSDATMPHARNPLITSLESIGYSAGQFSDKKALSDYLMPLADESPFLVPHTILQRERGFRFDVISPDGIPLGHRAEAPGIPACSTFTKGYGSNKIRGTGSLILLRQPCSTNTCDINMLITAGIRYFTPEEIARLHAFPAQGKHVLNFPASISLIQKYRLLGNSLNVKVVAVLLSRLFSVSINSSLT